MNSLLNINLVYKKTFALNFFTITCNAYNKNTNLISYGTKEGSVIFTQYCNGKLQFKNRNVTDAPIYNVNWLNDHEIACTYDDSSFVILNIHEDTVSHFEDSNIKFIKSIDQNTFYTCGRNKLAKKWDIRIMKPVTSFSHSGSVTCIENLNSYSFYTASTPGTIINFWDTRYTKRGVNFATKLSISNSFCRDLIYFQGNLYSKNILSHVHKISQTNRFKNLLLDTTEKSYCGSISPSEKYDSLFTCVDKEVFLINNKEFKKVELDFQYKSIGCICYKEDFVYLNDNQNIFVYEINPVQFYFILF